VQHRNAIRLTCIEEANAFDIHQMHFFQIQSYSWFTTFDLGPHLIQVLRSKVPAHRNPRFALTRNPFNPQRHRFLAPERILAECNHYAIHNSLKRCDLEVPRILSFEECLCGQENAVDWQAAAIESARLLNFEPKFVDSQALDF
jgi:hypothetical protein